MKRTVTILLVFALVFCLCACGRSNEPAGNNEPESGKDQPAALAAPEISFLGSITCQGVEIRIGNVDGATQYELYKDGELYKTLDRKDGDFTAFDDEFTDQEVADRAIHKYSAKAVNGSIVSEMSAEMEAGVIQ